MSETSTAGPGMVIFTQRRGIPFRIDPQDYASVAYYSWHMGAWGYPQTCIGARPTFRLVPLHRFLLGKAPTGMVWDHKNRDKLDNRRSNLRAALPSLNCRNQGPRRHNTSGVPGVNFQCGSWVARIGVDGSRRWLGSFKNKQDAVAARLAAEVAQEQKEA